MEQVHIPLSCPWVCFLATSTRAAVLMEPTFLWSGSRTFSLLPRTPPPSEKILTLAAASMEQTFPLPGNRVSPFFLNFHRRRLPRSAPERGRDLSAGWGSEFECRRRDRRASLIRIRC